MPRKVNNTTLVAFNATSDEFSWMANTHNTPVRINNLMWPTGEHYIQAMKYDGPSANMMAFRSAIQKHQYNGNVAEFLKFVQDTAERYHLVDKAKLDNQPGKKSWNGTPGKLDGESHDVMRQVIRAKLITNPTLNETFNDLPADTIVVNATNDAKLGYGPKGSGENDLGILYMEIIAARKNTLALQNRGPAKKKYDDFKSALPEVKSLFDLPRIPAEQTVTNQSPPQAQPAPINAQQTQQQKPAPDNAQPKQQTAQPTQQQKSATDNALPEQQTAQPTQQQKSATENVQPKQQTAQPTQQQKPAPDNAQPEQPTAQPTQQQKPAPDNAQPEQPTAQPTQQKPAPDNAQPKQQTAQPTQQQKSATENVQPKQQTAQPGQQQKSAFSSAQQNQQNGQVAPPAGVEVDFLKPKNLKDIKDAISYTHTTARKADGRAPRLVISQEDARKPYRSIKEGDVEFCRVYKDKFTSNIVGENQVTSYVLMLEAYRKIYPNEPLPKITAEPDTPEVRDLWKEVCNYVYPDRAEQILAISFPQQPAVEKGPAQAAIPNPPPPPPRNQNTNAQQPNGNAPAQSQSAPQSKAPQQSDPILPHLKPAQFTLRVPTSRTTEAKGSTLLDASGKEKIRNAFANTPFCISLSETYTDGKEPYIALYSINRPSQQDHVARVYKDRISLLTNDVNEAYSIFSALQKSGAPTPYQVETANKDMAKNFQDKLRENGMANAVKVLDPAQAPTNKETPARRLK